MYQSHAILRHTLGVYNCGFQGLKASINNSFPRIRHYCLFTDHMEGVEIANNVFKLINRQPEFRCDGHFALDSPKQRPHQTSVLLSQIRDT